MPNSVRSSLDERFMGGKDAQHEAENTEQKPAVQLQGKATIKSSPFSFFFRAVFNGSPKEVGTYILKEKLIPTVQYALLDIINSAAERLICGSNPRDGRQLIERSSLDISSSRPIRRTERAAMTSGYFFKELEYDYLSDAQKVKDELISALESYEKVSVAKYLEASGMKKEIEETDYGWGWRDLAGIDIRPTKNISPITKSRMYILTLPKPEPLS